MHYKKKVLRPSFAHISKVAKLKNTKEDLQKKGRSYINV